MKNNSLGNLRAFRAAAAAVIIMLSPACTKDDVTPQPCKGGPCDAAMFFPGERDVNGYYTIDLDWNGDYYPYFSIDIHATKVDSYYEYNGVGVVEGNFDSDTTWILPESGVEVNVVQETTIYKALGLDLLDHQSRLHIFETNCTHKEHRDIVCYKQLYSILRPFLIKELRNI